jgi:hypothetical protein
VRAIKYGSPDSLELKDIDKPVVGDDEVLVRVHAAGRGRAALGAWGPLSGKRGGRARMSSEQERLDRFDRAMTRLMQAHQDALEACRGVLDDRHEHPAGDDVGYIPEASTLLGAFAPPLDASASRSEEGRLYRLALEDVQTILVSASEDVHTILGEANEGGG